MLWDAIETEYKIGQGISRTYGPYLFSLSEAAPVLRRGGARYTTTIRDWNHTPLDRYVFSVREYGLKVLADLFAGRGHALKKCLFFRFA